MIQGVIISCLLGVAALGVHRLRIFCLGLHSDSAAALEKKEASVLLPTPGGSIKLISTPQNQILSNPCCPLNLDREVVTLPFIYFKINH